MKENVIYSKVITCKHFAAGELEESTFLELTLSGMVLQAWLPIK